MSVSNVTVKARYLGDGSVTTFPITFAFVPGDLDVVTVKVFDAVTKEEILPTPVYTLTPGGDEPTAVEFDVAPLADQIIIVSRVMPLTQVVDYIQNGPFLAETHETGLDRLVMMIQQIADSLGRSLQINIADDGAISTYLPPAVPGGVLGFNEDGDAVTVYAPGEFEGPPGPQGNPWFIGEGDPNGLTLAPTPNEGDSFINVEDMHIWSFDGTDWTDTGEVFPVGAVSIEGFSLRYNEFVDFENAQEALEYIFNLGYAAAQILSFTSSGSGTIREKGASVSTGALTANVKRNTNPIASVLFYKAGSLLYTVPTPNPDGGTESYTDVTPITDTTTYRVDVRDTVVSGQGNTLVQASLTYNYVFAYLRGPGAPGLNAAGVYGLTKDIIASTADRTISYTLTVGQVPYFAYPAAYGALTIINDANGFDVTSSFTRTTVNITNAYGEVASYYVYQHNNPWGINETTTFRFRR